MRSRSRSPDSTTRADASSTRDCSFRKPEAAPARVDGGPSLASAAERLGVTENAVKLAWLLQRSPVVLPIPGTLSIEHLRENLATLELSLDDAAGGDCALTTASFAATVESGLAAGLQPATTRFWAGCIALSKVLYRASEPSDRALEPSYAPARHRIPSNLDAGLSPSGSRRRVLELAG